ncbi:MAG: hypothetical protein Q8K60_06480 [Parachlamydiaceae bacterium]|nr:hypothetical protein [Parachlamydiaceae bacterium]
MSINDPNSQNPKVPPSPLNQDPLKKEKREEKKDAFEEKVRENLQDARDSKSSALNDYTNYTVHQIITYILLVLGLILFIFNNLIGGLIIGIVVGYYYSNDIIVYLRNFRYLTSDHLRFVTLIFLLIALFIAAPGIFVGAAIVAAFRQVIEGNGKPKDEI